MHLFLVTVLGNRWKLNGLDPDTPIEVLKLLVYRQTGMPPQQQQLWHGREKLTSLAGVREGSTLTLHPRLQTGF